jgi:2-dehydro-3-deoxyphosphogluconate aldolase/(4S)-4-hydroxy-2-oxoglutarate aldolase
MLHKIEILQKIIDPGLVVVVRAESADQAKRITDACIRGGVAAIEITFTVPGAVEVIRELASAYPCGEIVIGAGTVLDPETARLAILAGAQYVVSPCLSLDIVRLCNRYQVPILPGAMTIKEIVEAMEVGADIVKVFPGETLSPGFIKAVKGPLPQAPLMPTGGVSLDNAADWIKAGCVAVGVGGNITAAAAHGDYAAVATLARQFIEKIREARGR